jgi:hypothetical protein
MACVQLLRAIRNELMTYPGVETVRFRGEEVHSYGSLRGYSPVKGWTFHGYVSDFAAKFSARASMEAVLA